MKLAAATGAISQEPARYVILDRWATPHAFIDGSLVGEQGRCRFI